MAMPRSDCWQRCCTGACRAITAMRRSAPKSALGPSRNIVYRLAALFSLDAFAGGFVVQSLLALWLFQRFNLSLEAASLYFFCSSLLGAIFVSGGRLARPAHRPHQHHGVHAHPLQPLPDRRGVFAPSLTVVLSLLLVRSALSQMDVPTRSSYVMAVVTPAERTAAASVTAVPRSLASSISPAIAGFMLAGPFSGAAARRLRLPEDRLRPRPAPDVPAHQTAGRGPLTATGPVHAASVFSTSLIQYEVPNTMASSLKL